jgi:hypothetical protein
MFILPSTFVLAFIPSSKHSHHPLPPIDVREVSRPTQPIQLFYQDDRDDDLRCSDLVSSDKQLEMERSINLFLKASQKSFQNVEAGTNRLLNRRPLLALAIFLGTGLMVAYMMGIIFLGGYIENWNPAENDVVPYWDDPVLVIERKMGR